MTQNKSIFLLGLDPGFANLGYSVIELTSSGSKVVDAGIFHTEKSDKKRKILATEDNISRTKAISVFLNSIIDKWNISIICAESMSFPRNASAAAKVAMCWGVIVSIAQFRKKPIIQHSPQEIKLALCGIKSASKEDIEMAVEKSYPLAEILEGTARTYREHAYDSVSTIMVALEHELVRAYLGDRA